MRPMHKDSSPACTAMTSHMPRAYAVGLESCDDHSHTRWMTRIPLETTTRLLSGGPRASPELVHLLVPDTDLSSHGVSRGCGSPLTGGDITGPPALGWAKFRSRLAAASAKPSATEVVPGQNPYEVRPDAHRLVLAVKAHAQPGGAPAGHLPPLTQPRSQRTHASITSDLLHPGTHRDMGTVGVAPAVIPPRRPAHR
jgi:hypothetical protein